MNANLKYEIRARAFEIETGHMAPGKDSPCSMSPAEACDLPERRRAWDDWFNEFGDAVEATIKAMDEIEDYSPEKERVTDQPFHVADNMKSFTRLTASDSDRAALVEKARQTIKELEQTMRCNCDLDNWQPNTSTGHSDVCRIHKAAVTQISGL